MKITGAQVFHADAGYKTCSFLKLTTDEGVEGWTEYREERGGKPTGLTHIIARFLEMIVGWDPREYARISASLHATTRLTAGGLNHQAIAALENACIDIAAKAQGVPVYALFGGPFRREIDIYWTHCGSFRVAHPEFYKSARNEDPIETLDDLKALAASAVAQGLKAVKTNPVYHDGKRLRMFNGGFRIAPGFLDRNPSTLILGAIRDQLAAFREGLGPDAGLMLDASFSQRTEGYRRLARAVEDFDLTWLEIDTPDPDALALVRAESATPIASLESLYGANEYRPFFTRQAVDVGIVDLLWNGFWQSMRVATLADAHEVNVAPHNPTDQLGSLIAAHFCASIPNFRIMEYRFDEAPWTASFIDNPISIRNGAVILPDRPGWGADVLPEALDAHPPKRPMPSL